MSLITKQQFARMAGVIRATVESNITKGYLIEDKTGKMETENSINRKYLEKRIKKTPSKEEKQDTEKDIDSFTNMAVQEQKYKVDKLKMDIKVKELLLKEKRGDLVSKQKLSDVCFSYLENLNKNLLVIPQVFIDRVENFLKNKNLENTDDAKKELLNEISIYITKSIQNTKQQVLQRIEDRYEIEDEIEDNE
jgi:hypothetical protein